MRNPALTASRIRNQGDVLALIEEAEDLGDSLAFLRLIIADEPFMDIVLGEKLDGLTGVFAGDGFDLAEDPQGSKGEILEVPDRCGDDKKASLLLPPGVLIFHGSFVPVVRIEKVVSDGSG
jgi:hypothetical protein